MWDEEKIFKFAPLESETAEKITDPNFTRLYKEDTIVYYEDGKVFMRSEAALRILSRLKFPLTIMNAGLIIPKGLRDSVYKWVASRRYQYGQRYESCPLLSGGVEG